VKKKSKKKGKRYWKQKGCELAKKIVRESGTTCLMCGKTAQMHPHHILSTGAYVNMINVIENLIRICPTCHTFGKESFHGNGMEIKAAFDKKFPGRRTKLKRMALQRKNVNYEAEYKSLNIKI